MNKNEARQPKPGAYRGFVPGRRQSKHDRASGKEVDGMRFERQESAGGRSLFRHRDSTPDDDLVPAMQAVKIADRVDCAFQPERRQHRVRGEHEAVGHCVLPSLENSPTRTFVSQSAQPARRPSAVKSGVA